jgi:hypothetical protein
MRFYAVGVLHTKHNYFSTARCQSFLADMNEDKNYNFYNQPNSYPSGYVYKVSRDLGVTEF